MPLEFSLESIAASAPVGKSVTTFAEPLHQGETAVYTVQFQGPGATAIADTDFAGLELSYVDEESHIIVNGRNTQDVLNMNNVTLSATALLTWNIQAADTAFVDPTGTRKIEFHRAIFRATFDIGSGPEVAYHEVRIPVRRAFAVTSQPLS